jgi:hypothetical protein
VHFFKPKKGNCEGGDALVFILLYEKINLFFPFHIELII